MGDQEALTIVLSLAHWAVEHKTMSTDEYAESNEAIRVMEDITLQA